MQAKKMLFGSVFLLINLALVASDTSLPDDELFRLCIDFKKENLPCIKEIIEHPGYDINAEVNSKYCGSVTMLHATYWFYRWITDDKKRELARPVMKDIVILFLEHKANPHVMFPDCIIEDVTMEALFQDTINSAFKHVHMANDNEVKKLMQHYHSGNPNYPTVHTIMYYDSSFMCLDAIQEKTEKATITKNKEKILNVQRKLQAEHPLYKHQID